MARSSITVSKECESAAEETLQFDDDDLRGEKTYYIFLISHNSIIFPVNVECIVVVVLLYAKSTYKSILKSCKVKRKHKS